MSFVAVDLGASSTRYVSNSGVIGVLPNNMVVLPDMNQSLISPDNSDIESCLELTIVKEGGDSANHFPINVLVGIMAERHRNMDERPGVNSRKYQQRINYISAVLVCAVSKLKFELSDNLDLYIAVPPIEIHEAQEAFNRDLVGMYTVTFPKYLGGTVVRFTIDKVSTYEESFMASTSFFFNMNGVPKENAKKYLSGNVLSLDIGASTTDIAIIKNGRYLDKSGQTYGIGGNVARDNLIDQINGRYSMELPLGDAERTIAEGRVQQGNSFEDVSDLVNLAKTDLAKQLISYMQTYFKRINIPIQTINAIIVSGGGSMQSQYVSDDGEIVKTTEPMSYFVTQELLSWSKGTEVVEYGEEARFANVKGLFIRAKVDEAKRKTAAQTAQAAANMGAVQTAEPVAGQAAGQATGQVTGQVTGQTGKTAV